MLPYCTWGKPADCSAWPSHLPWQGNFKKIFAKFHHFFTDPVTDFWMKKWDIGGYFFAVEIFEKSKKVFAFLCKFSVQTSHQIIQQVDQICPVKAYPVCQIFFLFHWHMYVERKAETMAEFVCRYAAQKCPFKPVWQVNRRSISICHSNALWAVRARQRWACNRNKFYIPFYSIDFKHNCTSKRVMQNRITLHFYWIFCMITCSFCLRRAFSSDDASEITSAMSEPISRMYFSNSFILCSLSSTVLPRWSSLLSV